MRILFMGTPEFAVPALKALVSSGHELCGAVTQPDKPKNRGMKLQPTPVKEYAMSVDIPVFQPAKLRDGEVLRLLRELAPDLIVVAAYGKILPPDILTLPPLGCVNIHSSLLPKYRGAAPIQWAILNGETETGVTIMYMAEGLDTGDMIASVTTPIDPDETAQELHDRLAELGARLLLEVLPQLEAGTAPRTPQDESRSCYAPMLSKELSAIDWKRSARQIHDQARGLYPWPAAVAELDGVRCKLLKTTVPDQRTGKTPGAIVQADKRGLKIACGDGQVLEIVELQPDGKKPMAATAFLAGHPIPV